jgi:hypothetical protein
VSRSKMFVMSDYHPRRVQWHSRSRAVTHALGTVSRPL